MFALVLVRAASQFNHEMNTRTAAHITAVPCGGDGVDDGHGNEAEEGHQGNGWSCAAHVQGGQCAFAEHSHGSMLCDRVCVCAIFRGFL